jgi:hypothetical protein
VNSRRRGMSTTVLIGALVVVAVVAGALSFYIGQSGSGGVVTVTGAATTTSATTVSTATSSTVRTVLSTSTVGSPTTTVTTTVTSTSIALSLCPGCVIDSDGDGD